ncbi:thioesterase [Kalymmatonema gypsitolerans NIES-4073]|nr:thioesterase [Scytonema sp. NIES-4073]
MTTTIAVNPWIKYPHPNPQARLRLFCLPYAGAGASIFNAWPNNLPPDVEVCPIQLPGRESRLKEAPFTQILLLAQTLVSVLRPHLNIPFAFFGHSMGSLLSFEVTRQLRRQNAPIPVHLFVASRRAPQVLASTPPMHLLPEPAFIEKVRLVNGTSEAILQNPKWMQLFLPILRADLELCETYTYTPEAPLNCPISAFGGYQDGVVSQDEIAAWSVQTCSSFTLRMFSGNHFFLHSARVPLLQAISQDLIPFL